jgi:RNA 2',3'-cyclic 3'-phosphodiesterase
MSRLFIGVYPPAEVAQVIRELPHPVMSGVRWVPEHQWHITLRFFGNADEPDALAAFAAIGDHPGVTAEMGPYVSRLGRDVVCIPVRGIESLAASVARATADVGEPPDPRPFAGHLTLARLRGRGTCGVAGERFNQAFRVSELALVRSTLSSSGAEHETIATRPVGT